ncbi:MAG TPA: hypothetical protein VIK14_17250 [Ignavibacteria bacterium]
MNIETLTFLNWITTFAGITNWEYNDYVWSTGGTEFTNLEFISH